MTMSLKELMPLLLAVLTSIGALLFSGHFPEEDAFILFRYSENFAHTGVITYNPGDSVPVEGATDFLWMVLLAGLYKIGIPTYAAAKLLSLASLWGMCTLFLRIAPEGEDRQKFLASLLMIMILQLPFLAAAAGFSTYFFGFWLMLAAYAFYRERFSLMVVASLIACLTRPDGCIYTITLIGLAFLSSPQLLRNPHNRVALIGSALVGAGYFLWRWHYFGLLLPLPFYVKADIPRTLGIFNLSSLYQVAQFLGVYLPLIAYIFYAGGKRLFSAESHKIHVLSIAYVVVPLLFYGTLDLFQNVYFRYFFPIIMILMLFAVVQRTPKTAGKFLLCISLSLLFQFREYVVFSYLNSIPSPLIAIARDIGTLPTKGKMVTAEAGILPYYSGWKNYDIYGLDTPSVALGQVQVHDIKRFGPDLIFVYNTSHFKDTSSPPSRYDKMIAVILADTRGQPYDIYKLNGGYYFLIQRSSQLHDALVKILQHHGAIQASLD